MKLSVMAVALGGIFLASIVDARADVVIDWVPVGDPGNVGELSGQGAGGYGPNRICGAVASNFLISQYEVTNGQYIEFLNAVAATDTHGLYYPGMGGNYGGITRTGSPGNYTYALKNGDPAWGTRPVNHVDWYDTLRFANWMHNGQPTGAQAPSATEDGAYDMSLGANVVRKPGAQVFLPSEDEWYKAAFFKGGGPLAGYWDYATQSDTTPTSEGPPGGDNSANYDWAVGVPYFSTDVGAYVNSESAYDTFDQNGNMMEWNEALIYGSRRGLRGGSWHDPAIRLSASYRFYLNPSYEYSTIGFRVASIPAPPANLLGAIGLALVTWTRRRL